MPRPIVESIVVAAVLGMVLVIVLTVAINDISRGSATNSAVALILREQLGPVVERTLSVRIVFAFLGAGLVMLATCARMVFAMSRDARFPAHRLMRRVSPRTHTPIPATILIVLVGAVLMATLRGDALLVMLTAGGLIGAVLYGAIIVLYLGVRKGVGRQEDASISGVSRRGSPLVRWCGRSS